MIKIEIKPLYLILCTVGLGLALVVIAFWLIVSFQERPERMTIDQQIIDATFKNIGGLAKRKALSWPVECKTITSGFGWRHNPIRRFIGGLIVGYHAGIDLSTTNGTPVLASGDGELIALGRSLVGGRYLVVDYGDGITMTYYHLSAYNWKKGITKVIRGQIIAYSGNTGITTGRHLHCQVEYYGVPVNPYMFFEIAD